MEVRPSDLIIACIGFDYFYFISNFKLNISGVPAELNTVRYECCPEPYLDITFTVRIRR